MSVDFSVLESGRRHMSEHRNDPCDKMAAEEIAYGLATSLLRASPATMSEGVASFLANYAWNSMSSPSEAKAMMRRVLKRAEKIADECFQSEAHGGSMPPKPN